MIGAGVGHSRSGTIVIYDRHDALAEVPEEFDVVERPGAVGIGLIAVEAKFDRRRDIRELRRGEGHGKARVDGCVRNIKVKRNQGRGKRIAA